MYCEDCGTKLSGGICPNCSEELLIFTEQNEWLPDKLSDDFMNKVEEQKSQEKNRIKEKKYYQLYINGRWEGAFNTYEEAETTANANFEGEINIEKY